MTGSYIRNILKAATKAEVISLAGGLPDIELLPKAVLEHIAYQQMSDSNLFQYGESAGYLPLREWIADEQQCHIDQLIITNGAQQGLDLVTRCLLRHRERIVVEAPAYLGATQVFNLQNLTIDWLLQLGDCNQLEHLEAAFKRAKVFYCVPNFHNPTGSLWSLALRKAVVALAEQHQVTIIEDAPYEALSFSDHQLPSLYQMAPNNVIKLGSFSKSIAPGLRTGYCLASPGASKQLLKAKQAMDLHSSNINQALTYGFVSSKSYKPHLKNIRQTYSIRMAALIDALSGLENVKVEPVQGGMFLWARLIGRDADTVTKAALETYNLAIVPGRAFMPVHDTAADEFVRLNFTNAEPSLINEAVDRLAQAMDAG